MGCQPAPAAPERRAQPEVASEAKAPTERTVAIEETLRVPQVGSGDAQEAATELASLSIQLPHGDETDGRNFPASNGRGEVMVVVSPWSCCANLGTRVELRSQDGGTRAWILENPENEAPLSEQAGHIRRRAVNAALQHGHFVAMEARLDARGSPFAPSLPQTLHGGLRVEASETRFRVTRDGKTQLAPRRPYRRSSDCCDGGLGMHETCVSRGDLFGVWTRGNLTVVAQGIVSQQDGCTVGPDYRIMTDAP